MSPEKRCQVEAEGAKRGPRRSFSCWHPVLAFSRTRRKCWGYFTYGTVLWRPLQRNTVMMLLLAKLPFAQCDITAVNENVHLETCALRKLVFMSLYELQLNNRTVPITICKLGLQRYSSTGNWKVDFRKWEREEKKDRQQDWKRSTHVQCMHQIIQTTRHWIIRIP